MSKVKLLLDVISDVRSLADSLQKVADAITDNEPEKITETAEEKNTEKKIQPKKEKVKEYSLEDVRGVLAEKSQNGLTLKVKELITRFGGSRLSDIDPKDYAEIIKAAEVLGNE